MRHDTLIFAMGMIYAAFGKPAPVGRVIDSVAARTQHIPDEAMAWIIEQICDEARLPENIGRAIVRGWDAWQQAHPERLAKAVCRLSCDAGYRHCWRNTGTADAARWAYFVAPCPACQRREVPILSTRELEAGGVVVMPGGFRGGPLEFDRQHGFGVLWPRGTVVGSGVDMRRVAGEMPSMRQERQRLAALTDNELRDAAGW